MNLVTENERKLNPYIREFVRLYYLEHVYKALRKIGQDCCRIQCTKIVLINSLLIWLCDVINVGGGTCFQMLSTLDRHPAY